MLTAVELLQRRRDLDSRLWLLEERRYVDLELLVYEALKLLVIAA